MKKNLLPIFLVALMAFTACGTSKFFSQSASSVRPIALVEPYSHITDAFGDFSTKYLEETSQLNQELVLGIMTSIGLPLEKYISYDYAAPDSSLSRWMKELAGMTADGARQLKIPAELRNAVRKSGCRYGMLLTDVGFVKNPHEYAAELAIETGLKVIDLLAFNSLDLSKETERNVNGVFSLIFDSETGEVIWFGNQPRDYKHNPLDRGDLEDQIRKLYKDFL